MKHSNTPGTFTRAFLLLAAAVVAYILARAWLIPVTHDEAATSYLVVNHDLSRLITYNYGSISANNHVFNTVLIKFWSGMWGLSPLTLRLGNLLAGVFYLWCGYFLLNRFFQSDALKTAGLLIWIGNPFLLEFFALARGYGLSAAMESGAIVFGALYLQSGAGDPQRLRNLRAAFVFAALAVWANFALLYFYACFTGLMFFAMLRSPGPRRRLEVRAALLTSLLLILLIYEPMARIERAGDFGYFGNKGFMEDTVRGFADCLLMGRRYFGDGTLEAMQWALTGICVASLAAAILVAGRNRWRLTPHAWLLALLPGVVITNLLATKATGSSYLSTRTTLFLFPLLACSLLGLAKLLFDYRRMLGWGLASVFAILLAFNLLKNANIREAYEWRYDRDTYTVLHFMEKAYDAESRTSPFTLRCHCLQHPSFRFYIDWMKSPRYTRIVAPDVQEVPCTVAGPVDTGVDFYYVPAGQLEHFRGAYDVVLELGDDAGKRVLLRKKGPG